MNSISNTSDTPQGALQKQCSKCAVPLPFISFSLDKSKPDGHRPDCKDCVKQLRVENADVIKLRRQRYYAANKDEILQRDRQSRDRRADKIRETKRKYATSHIEEIRKGQQDYRRRNSSQLKIKKQHYIEQNRELISARWRAYRLANLDAKKAYQRQWQKNNPDKIAAHGHARRARKRNNGGKFTAIEWGELKNHYQRKCLCCGATEPQIKLTPDHVIPLIKGGSNDIENIQPLCLSCNCKKKDKAIDYRI